VIDHRSQTSDEQLRRVLSIMDAALSRLDTEALYRELLERVGRVLGTDMAAIMLLDADAQQLFTVAAIGLEAEVEQGFRVDVGAGFAGRVAAERATVIVERVDRTELISPILRETPITTLIGVPMLAGGDLVGVLNLGTYQPHEFSSDDVALLQMVADRAALAAQAAQTTTDRAATLALQRSLLPSRLPATDQLDLAARYLPGHHLGIGGDWYDVFPLPTGELGIVVGDVTGHGLRSAVVMGRLRSALRAYALVEDDPATVLSFLDRKITHFEAGNLATILYAKISPDRRRMTISSAGHLPPVLASPDFPAHTLTLPVDLPVGVGDSGQRRSTTITLCPDSVIVFYTDGLVERRGEIIDQGLHRLCHIVTTEHPETVCTAIMASMGVSGADDDIAILAARVRP
jgi:putative methionine-R-sulfoxide reductase with GAF domain